jgi:hypothetical protein
MRYQNEINRIESMADSKGIDVDDIEVEEDEDGQGNEIIRFLVYETKRDTLADSIVARISKLPNNPMADQQFQNDVSSTLSELKKHVSTDQDLDRPERKDVELTDDDIDELTKGEDVDPDQIDQTPADESDTTETSTPASDTEDTTQSTTDDVTLADPSQFEGSPEAKLQAEREQMATRIAELEARVEELEEYVDALEGLSQLVDN